MYRISTVQLWVDDQDEALAFYTTKVGMEVRSDVTLPELGDFRWLTVGPKTQPELRIVLMKIGAGPKMDEASAAQLRELVEKGALGGGVVECDDIQKTYEELKGRGVEFVSEPKQMPYGIEAVFRDDTGNFFSLGQKK